MLEAGWVCQLPHLTCSTSWRGDTQGGAFGAPAPLCNTWACKLHGVSVKHDIECPCATAGAGVAGYSCLLPPELQLP